MLETFLESPIGLAIAGGIVHGSVFGAKAYIDGEEIDPIKWALTVVLAGLIGFVFFIVGFEPTATDWVFVLFAFAGLVAELEAIVKLLARGQVYEARHRLALAREETFDGATRVATSETGARMSEQTRQRLDEAAVGIAYPSTNDPLPVITVDSDSADNANGDADTDDGDDDDDADESETAEDTPSMSNQDHWEESYEAIEAAADGPNEYANEINTPDGSEP